MCMFLLVMDYGIYESKGWQCGSGLVFGGDLALYEAERGSVHAKYVI